MPGRGWSFSTNTKRRHENTAQGLHIKQIMGKDCKDCTSITANLWFSRRLAVLNSTGRANHGPRGPALRYRAVRHAQKYRLLLLLHFHLFSKTCDGSSAGVVVRNMSEWGTHYLKPGSSRTENGRMTSWMDERIPFPIWWKN